MLRLLLALFWVAGAAHLGSKTVYEPPHGAPMRAACPVVHLNHLSRHGSRHVSKLKKVEAVQRSLSERQACLSEAAGRALQQHVSEFAEQSEPHVGRLAPLGREELGLAATRLLQAFPDALGRGSGALVFESSPKGRAVESRDAFKAALLDEVDEQRVRVETPATCEQGARHSLLRFHDDCPAYVGYASAKPWRPAVAQQRQKHAALADETAARLFTCEVADKWGILEDVYSLCQIQAGALGEPDKICSAFGPDALQALEWLDDAEAYHKKALPGSHVSSRVACPLLTDMLRATRAAAAHPGREDARFRFAHAETLLPLLRLLGLVSEEDPLHAHPHAERGFETSAAIPMGANLVWALTDCGGEEGLHLQAWLNERPVALPGCPADPAAPCPLLPALEAMEKGACSTEAWEEMCGGRLVCGRPLGEQEL